jgi:hypothetical protein
MYKVEYYSSSGSKGDNRCIGIYLDKQSAQIAKDKYIQMRIGTKPSKEEAGLSEIEEWEYDFERLDESIDIDYIKNMF